jgi:hypothetical protein
MILSSLLFKTEKDSKQELIVLEGSYDADPMSK